MIVITSSNLLPSNSQDILGIFTSNEDKIGIEFCINLRSIYELFSSSSMIKVLKDSWLIISKYKNT